MKAKEFWGKLNVTSVCRKVVELGYEVMKLMLNRKDSTFRMRFVKKIEFVATALSLSGSPISTVCV